MATGGLREGQISNYCREPHADALSRSKSSTTVSSTTDSLNVVATKKMTHLTKALLSPYGAPWGPKALQKGRNRRRVLHFRAPE